MRRGHKRILAGLPLLFLASSGCSDSTRRQITVRERDNGYLLSMQVGQLKGLCFTPQAMDLNSNLVIEELKAKRNTWVAVNADKSRIENLDYVLAAGRKRIVGPKLEFVVEKAGLVQRPFYCQFTAFSCDAPRKSQALTGMLTIVSVVADLEPYMYTRELLKLASPQ